MALLKLGKCLGCVREYVEECDLFSSNILLRFKNENQFKTLTSALVSIFLVTMFIIVFANRFITTANKQNVTLQTAFIEEMDPTLYKVNTSDFMFVVGLDGVNLSSDSTSTQKRYFDVGAHHVTYHNGAIQKEVPILLEACTVQHWSKYGGQFASRYSALKLNNWLCPVEGQIIQIQGKFSSQSFKTIKVFANKCTGSDCATDAEFQTHFQGRKNFKLLFYFTKSVLNPVDRSPISMTLEDSTYTEFSLTQGSTCNLFMQSYTITTDESLWPSEDPKTIQGITTSNTPQLRSYLIDENSTNVEYSSIYMRKSPRSRIINRGYTKYDDFLSYIGGLFGLISTVFSVPLYYYNLCCYELSLATNMFTYKKLGDDDTEPVADQPISVSKKRIERKDSKIIKQQKQQRLKHSVSRFNFLRFIGFLPYYIAKILGAQKLYCDEFQPYYEAITQIRKHIDIGKILQRFTYIDRMSKSLLDEDQRNLLHVYEKQNIWQIYNDRMGYKIQSHARRLKDDSVSPVPKKFSRSQDPIQQQKRNLTRLKLANSYKRLAERQDEISKRILKGIDPELLKIIIQAVKKDNISPQSAQDLADIHLQIRSEVDDDQIKRCNSLNQNIIQSHVQMSASQNIFEPHESMQALDGPRPLQMRKSRSYDEPIP